MTSGIRKVWGNFIDEKDYQHYFVDRLVKDNGFVRRENKHIDQATAMDVGMLIGFLEDTQPKAMAALAKTYGANGWGGTLWEVAVLAGIGGDL